MITWSKTPVTLACARTDRKMDCTRRPVELAVAKTALALTVRRIP